MEFTIITLFPEIMETLTHGIIGKAFDKGLMTLNCINPRDFTHDKHRSVDDTPYGGGAGMVMRAEPLLKAVAKARECQPESKVIHLTPQGKAFDQSLASEASATKGLIFIAGRYEGIDQRVLDTVVDEEWSLGDYVISGGELAACVMIDAISRMIPGVVGDASSVTTDTFYQGLLKYPQYTRPEEIAGQKVPDILLSGDHAAIEKWRKKHSLGNTWLKRPDLLERIALTQNEEQLLNDFKHEHEKKHRS